MVADYRRLQARESPRPEGLDDCGFQGQWQRYPPGLRPVRCALSHLDLFTGGRRRDRRQQFQAMSNRDENPCVRVLRICVSELVAEPRYDLLYRIERICAVLGRAAAIESGYARLCLTPREYRLLRRTFRGH